MKLTFLKKKSYLGWLVCQIPLQATQCQKTFQSKYSKFQLFNYRKRLESPFYFLKIDLYVELLRLLTNYHFRINSRRFMLELFDEMVFTDHTLDKLFQLKGVIPKYIEREKSDEKSFKSMASLNSLVSFNTDTRTESQVGSKANTIGTGRSVNMSQSLRVGSTLDIGNARVVRGFDIQIT